MPRWIILSNYLLATLFLFFAGQLFLARYLFPACVFLMSVYILILTYRRKQDQESEEVFALNE